MIISREYVRFSKLVESRDPAGKLFMELLKKTYPKDRWDEAYSMLKDYCLYQREMEWGFCHIGELIKGFQQIDHEHPYDNGYSLADIWGSEVLRNDGETITLLLTTSCNEEFEIIAIKKLHL